MEPVLLSSILFSDSVIQEHGTGKLSLIGTFHLFRPNRLPFTPPPFFITTLLTNLPNPPKEMRVTLRIEAVQSSHVVFSGTATLRFHDASVPFPDFAVFEVPFLCPNVTFPEAGRYRVTAFVNDETIGQRYLSIEVAKPDPATN